MTQNLANLTPVEIDTVLSGIWAEQQEAEMKVLRQRKLIAERTDKIKRIMKNEKFFDVRTPADGIQLMKRLIAATETLDWYLEDVKQAQAKALPYENEYVRRGAWNRVFLATSHNGHAHNGQNCSTCHNGESRTGFAWLIRYSGATEAEIVADAGERACTTCYPSAPANAKGTKMFTPDEEEAAKRREERETERVRKAQDAADKSITTPEGGPLYESKDRTSYGQIKNIRVAETCATDALVELANLQRQAKDPEFAFLFEGSRDEASRTKEWAAHAWCLIRSIAHKKGQTFEETFQVHEKKAQAKIRKNAREWAKDPRNPNRNK